MALGYAAGLRVGEVASLRVSDSDFENGLLIIRQGKGNKDRRTIISKKIIGGLKELVGDKNLNDYIFKNNRGGKLTERAVQKVFYNVLKKC